MAAAERLDRVLRRLFPTWGRQAVQQLIGARQVLVNGQAVWLASWQVHDGDRLTLLTQPQPKPQAAAAFAEEWLLAVEADLIAVAKPAGLLAEPPHWGEGANLRDLAIARFGPLTLVHRLDRDTSGVMVLTRTAESTRRLAQGFQRHTIRKEYVAVVQAPNALASEGVIDLRLGAHPSRRDMAAVVTKGGDRAVTRYQVVATTGERTWVRLLPETGRMHQLRVQLAYLGAPILGDRLYGGGAAARLLLHAHAITVPGEGKAHRRAFVAPIPDEFAWPETYDERV